MEGEEEEEEGWLMYRLQYDGGKKGGMKHMQGNHRETKEDMTSGECADAGGEGWHTAACGVGD